MACDTVSNSDQPFLSANLPGTGFRFQSIIPPISEGPVIVIRIPTILNLKLDDYKNNDQLTASQLKRLQQAALNKENLLIVGGTGSGKTTFGNAFLNEICSQSQKPDPRIILIEDSEELVSPSANTSRFLTHGIFDTGSILRECMRCNPERIVIGETRDGATALGLLKAFNSGHPGGFTTIHADSAQKGLKKLVRYLGEELKHVDPREVSEAINIAVFLDTNQTIKDIIAISDEVTASGEFIFNRL